MTATNIQQIATLLLKKRGPRGIRDVASEIGISPATLSRVERGHLPDLGTFAKICKWLDLDPAAFLGLDHKKPVPEDRAAIAHFRASKTTTADLAKALAQMILAAQNKLASE